MHQWGSTSQRGTPWRRRRAERKVVGRSRVVSRGVLDIRRDGRPTRRGRRWQRMQAASLCLRLVGHAERDDPCESDHRGETNQFNHMFSRMK